jgi:apolipoprotein N-acyltransferase
MTMSLEDRKWRFVAALASGILLDLALSLEPWWWAAWLAPIPLLIAAFRAASYREALALAAVTALISNASTVGFMVALTGFVATAVVISLRVFVWCVMVSLTRAAVLRSPNWFTVFVYPASYVAAETIVFALSPHGTGGSLAYSQMHALPIIQIAAATGTAGIVFLVSLFASAVAIAWHRRRDVDRPLLTYGLPAALIAAVLGFGWMRLVAPPAAAEAVPVGLAVIDGASPSLSGSASPQDAVWTAYTHAVTDLAKQGAKIVVLPEKIALLDDPARERVQAVLAASARDNRVYLVVGVALSANDERENRAWMFAPSGELIADYSKQHLVPGWEARFKPGASDVVRGLASGQFGIAICKDMDFSDLGRRYALREVNAMLVPAWDFKRDAWSHASWAILRGVEGGFSIVRAARRGLLTISDRYGRVLSEKASTDGAAVLLVTTVPLGPGIPTLYARFGDWFGWLSVAMSLIAWLSVSRQPRVGDGAVRRILLRVLRASRAQR